MQMIEFNIQRKITVALYTLEKKSIIDRLKTHPGSWAALMDLEIRFNKSVDLLGILNRGSDVSR